MEEQCTNLSACCWYSLYVHPPNHICQPASNESIKTNLLNLQRAAGLWGIAVISSQMPNETMSPMAWVAGCPAAASRLGKTSCSSWMVRSTSLHNRTSTIKKFSWCCVGGNQSLTAAGDVLVLDNGLLQVSGQPKKTWCRKDFPLTALSSMQPATSKTMMGMLLMRNNEECGTAVARQWCWSRCSRSCTHFYNQQSMAKSLSRSHPHACAFTCMWSEKDFAFVFWNILVIKIYDLKLYLCSCIMLAIRGST